MSGRGPAEEEGSAGAGAEEGVAGEAADSVAGEVVDSAVEEVMAVEEGVQQTPLSSLSFSS